MPTSQHISSLVPTTTRAKIKIKLSPTSSSTSMIFSSRPKQQALTVNKYFGYMGLLLIILIACSSITQSKAEYFSSIDSLQTLGDIELMLVKNFQQYLEAQQREFACYRKFIEQVKLQHDLAMKDAGEYLGNPINAFTLIKRMVIDWSSITTLMTENQAQLAFQKTVKDLGEELEMPDDSELRGAAKGLARLQTIYNITTPELVDGEINGIDYGAELSWHDCFEIAVNLFQEKYYKRAIEWFDVTLQLLENEEDEEGAAKFELDSYEYLALAHYELGLVGRAMEYINGILETQPDHSIKDVKLYISQSNKAKKPWVEPITLHEWYGNYSSLCQGVFATEPPPNRFQCRIDTKNNPIFILAPLKIEPLHIDPDITLYHQLLNDDQIEKILTLAENDMHRSMVAAGVNASAVQDVRVSQQAWLNYETPIMTTVNRLVAQITGMDMKNAEIMQTANYGIGGQYDPHPDFFARNETIIDGWLGDRIVTNMFYLSDVEQGGYTVFPRLNIFLQPVKGALVNWFNLHKDVRPDWRTLHAGCPVVKGSKRIGNVWIHSGMQEFRRPCDLEPDYHRSVQYANIYDYK